MTDLEIAPAFALAHVDPEFFDKLTGIERLVLAFDLELWLRPDQRIPRYPWRSFGFEGGRGFGKSLAIAHEFNYRIEHGLARAPALMAPNEDRVKEVQVDFLIATSPPWFRAEAHDDGVRWPNGVEAVAYTPLAPGRSRSGNHDLTWMCEIVDWQAATRLEAYRNLATATRVGDAQIIWDTTSKGKNEVIQHLIRENKRNPRANPIVTGTTFDNPLLSKQYLQALVAQYVKGSRAYDEEINGLVFTESAGALWCQSWLDDGRWPQHEPSGLELVIVALDPSLSAGSEADEFGSVVIGRDELKHVHVLDDLSGRQAPERAVAAAIDRCEHDAAGIIYERNHAGDMPLGLAKVICRERGLRVEVLDDPKRPFPERRPGVVYVRSITSAESKGSRAEAPAALYQQGRAHHAKVFDLLELEMTTWEPGGKSPNRLDACVHGIAELADLRVPDDRSDGDECTRAEAAQRLLRSSLLRGGGGGRRFGL